MSFAFWRSVGFISPLLIGGQASPLLGKSKQIRHTMKRQAEFLESRLRCRLLQEQRIPEG
jgi:hypothetical protein